MKKWLSLIICLLSMQFNLDLRASSQPAAAAAGAGAARAQTAQSKVTTPSEIILTLISIWLKIINPPVETQEGLFRLLGLIDESKAKKDFKDIIIKLKHHAPAFLKTYPFLVEASPDQDMVEFLVQHGAPVDQQNDDGDTALHVIVRSDLKDSFDLRSPVIDFLLKSGANPNIKNKSGWSFNQAKEKCKPELAKVSLNFLHPSKIKQPASK
jgi:ankyrin repeat protein